MLAFQAGDDAAFDELVRRCKRDVFALGYRYGLTPADADDLAQEVFVRVYRSRETYRPSARFRTWLLRIATNLVISEARKRKLRKAASLQAMRVGSDDGEVDIEDPRDERPWDRLDAVERSLAIEEALEKLPDSQRTALILNRFEELSYEEVGEALGLKIPAVKSLLFRARQNLKAALERFMDR